MWLLRNTGHNFHERTQRALDRRASRAVVRFLKMAFMVHCDFEKGHQSQHFQKYAFGRDGGSRKKKYSVYMYALLLLIMLTILDDPLVVFLQFFNC